MSCTHEREAVLAAARAESAPPEVERQLQSCPACRETFERERRLLGQIDEVLGDALSLRPSPELLPRIRRAVESSKAPSWSSAWFLPVAAGGAALAVAAWLLARPPAAQRPAPEARIDPPPASASAAPPVSAPPAVPAKAAAARRPWEPEVLVTPGQEAELQRLVAALRSGRVDATSLLGEAAPPPQDLAVAPLAEVAPLEVKPLVSETGSEGVDQ